ncbi:hypothetical protein N0V95_001140 [Ascochyta clinopodiicola]|nr:hypothetical protein N0V95_001140 [Ascochyta clinopodiicola]
MPGTKKTDPAGWIGSRRRKLIRRNHTNGEPPRSSTMPVLNSLPVAATLRNTVSSLGSAYVKERKSEDSYDQHRHENQQGREKREGKMQSYPHNGAVKLGAPYTFLADDPVTSSPKLTATDGKRKHGLFGTRRPKALDRPNSSPHAPVVTSPLPATTPSKAAQFFGLESKPEISESPRRGRFQDDAIVGDDDNDDVLVRPMLRKQFSLSLLTKFKAGPERRTRLSEEDGEPDLLKSEKTGKINTNRGLRMLIPNFASPRRAPIQQTTAATTRFGLDKDDPDLGYSSDSGLQGSRFRIPAAPRSVHAAPKRRASKKTPKPFQRMSPITETSHEELRANYRQDRDATNLGVISEYEYDDTPYSGPVLPRSRSELAMPPRGTFKLDEDDLSPTDEFYDEEATNGEDDTVHPGTKVNFKQVPWQQPSALHKRSPLQSIEDDFLDAAEEETRIEACRKILARVEIEKQAMDAEIAVLMRAQERMKHRFRNDESGDCVSGGLEPTPDECSDEDAGDLLSLRSSIDFDEEPTVHEAKLMTSTRISPGAVKLVDIPFRMKKQASYAGSNTLIGDKLILPENEKKPITSLSQDENILPASVSTSTYCFLDITDKPKPVVTHYHHEDPDHASKRKKSKLTRDESLLLVQNWISNYNSTEQRPLSTRVDADVLADQETPPAPFPKSDESLPTPPIKPRFNSLAPPRQLQKHQCIINGHIFHPIDLKHIPDNAVVNSLEVRPYLQTYTGVKYHVKIPVLCEKCGEDCNENVWECEIAVCRMAVCQSCAENMEAEWQERTVRVTVIVGSGARATTYNLPVALLCFHSCFFKNELLRYKKLRARAYGNKKRKASPQEESTIVKVEEVDEETDADVSAQYEKPEETVIRLPDVDLTIFGLFLKYVYTVPPSVHAYLLSIRLSAPGFLNQALNHIYYGIGKYFTLTPSLVDYICSHTTPGSTLRKLVLDVLVVHWPSLSTHIIAKHAALNKYWNEVFDTHKDFRHAFTMGLQGSAKVLPVQGYFVSMAISAVATKEEAAEREVEIVEVRSVQVDTSAAEAAAEVAAAEQGDESCGEGKK